MLACFFYELGDWGRKGERKPHTPSVGSGRGDYRELILRYGAGCSKVYVYTYPTCKPPPVWVVENAIIASFKNKKRGGKERQREAPYTATAYAQPDRLAMRHTLKTLLEKTN